LLAVALAALIEAVADGLPNRDAQVDRALQLFVGVWSVAKDPAGPTDCGRRSSDR
jgi:hypothetical protein